MKNFNRSKGSNDHKAGASFGRRDSGERGFNRGTDYSRPAKYKAVCAQCGQSCEVPFKPSGDRPVLCSHCFKGKDGFSPKRSSNRDFARAGSNERKLFTAVCAQCGQSCEVPFKPLNGKPVYCRECFGQGDKAKNITDSVCGSHGDSSDEQFTILSAKLDQILRSLNPAASSAPALKAETAKASKGLATKSVFKKTSKKIPAPKAKRK